MNVAKSSVGIETWRKKEKWLKRESIRQRGEKHIEGGAQKMLPDLVNVSSTCGKRNRFDISVQGPFVKSLNF